ncbi:MAG: hypothetical protein QNL14_06685 [Deltaproteobacteria bacterium]|nr:hypothetical protein [Deltaproteobacteria bacterium]
MDISSNNQLVPYNQGPRQVTPYAPRKTAPVPADGNPRPRRYVPEPAPRYHGPMINSENQESIYTANSQSKAQETHRVGLLINIYA